MLNIDTCDDNKQSNDTIVGTSKIKTKIKTGKSRIKVETKIKTKFKTENEVISISISKSSSPIIECISNDIFLKEKHTNQYTKMSNYYKSIIADTVKSVKETLIFYKSVSFIYPDWLNTKYNKNASCIDPNTHHLFQEIGYFIMTRTIDDKYVDIPEYRNCINNPFNRGLWHIASSINFALIIDSTKNEKHCNNDLHLRFLRFFDAFCMLSRTKTQEEFESSYDENYRRITKRFDPSKKVKIPYWIYDQYKNHKPETIFSMLKHCTHYTSLITKNIDSNMFYFLLSNSFKINYVELKSIIDKPIHDNHFRDNHYVVEKSNVDYNHNKWIEVGTKRSDRNLQPLYATKNCEQISSTKSRQNNTTYVPMTYHRSFVSVADNSNNWRSTTEIT